MTFRTRDLFRIAALAALCLPTACARPADPLLAPHALGSGSLAGQLIVSSAKSPPSQIPGQCWADAVTPAVFETSTTHELLRPSQPASPGHAARAAEYQTVTHQRILQDRRHVWFRTPCPDLITPDLIATLQRALLARGYYNGAIDGVMDAATSAALRRYQSQLGLDSETLALGTAQDLGLVPYPLPPRDESDQN